MALTPFYHLQQQQNADAGSQSAVLATFGATPHEAYVEEVVCKIAANDNKSYVKSTMPFAGVFFRWVKDSAQTETVCQVRFGRQGNTQRGGWVTINSGFSIAFPGGGYADCVEFRRVIDPIQPQLTGTAAFVVCAVLNLTGNVSSGTGA